MSAETSCEVCGAAAPLRCGRCRRVFYCSQPCQKAGWSSHRSSCCAKEPQPNPAGASCSRSASGRSSSTSQSSSVRPMGKPATTKPAAANIATTPLNLNSSSLLHARPLGTGSIITPQDFPGFGSSTVYFNSADGVDENLLVLLHGLGDEAANFVSFGRSVKLPQTALLGVRAPRDVPLLGGGMWWDGAMLPNGERGEGPRVDAAITATARALTEHLVRLVNGSRGSSHWTAERLHVLGFGDGGVVALACALECVRAGFPLGSVAAVCVVLPDSLCEALDASCSSSSSSPSSSCRTSTALLLHRGLRVATTSRTLTGAGISVRCVDIGQGGGSSSTAPDPELAMPRSASEMRPLMELWGNVLSHRPVQLEGLAGVLRVG